jgi:hypothetical protein
MDGGAEIANDRVCEAQGRFIAFWRGRVVSKLDGTLRNFASEREAWEFLGRRNAVGDSMFGARRRSQRD